MPTKVTLELIINDKAFYESENNETIEKYIESFQKLAKTFSYVKECNIICIVREGKRNEIIKVPEEKRDELKEIQK